MNMKHYLIDFFKYNDWANHQLFESVRQIPDPSEPLYLISHIISAQDRWLNRITHELDEKPPEWYRLVVALDEIEPRWTESLDRWLKLLEKTPANELDKEIIFEWHSDNKKISVKIIDMALQVNYHSIHHRAQIYRIIRQQGHVPPTTDYIKTVMREVEPVSK